ncbi:MAG TPA: pentapeptide repeat-containing protein [Humisphaera sp.]
MGKPSTDAAAARWTTDAVEAARAFIEGRTNNAPFGSVSDGRIDLQKLPLDGFYRPVGVRLQGVDFSGLNSTGRIIFASSRLTECTFDGATMKWGDFESEFESVTFRRAKMRGSGFGSSYGDCDFSSADTRGSNGLEPRFRSCRFTETRLDDSVINTMSCSECVFSGLFRGVLFGTVGPVLLTNCDLAGARFVDCSFKHARFESCLVADHALLFTDWPTTLARFEEAARGLTSEGLRLACQHWGTVWRELGSLMPQNLVDLDDLIAQSGEHMGRGLFEVFRSLHR